MEHSPVTRKRSERVSSVTAEPKNRAPRVRRHMSPGASVVRPRLDRERLREEGGLALEGEQHLVAGSELAASGAKCRHPVAEACRVRAIWQAPVIFHLSPDGCSSGRSASLGRAAFAGRLPQRPLEPSRPQWAPVAASILAAYRREQVDGTRGVSTCSPQAFGRVAGRPAVLWPGIVTRGTRTTGVDSHPDDLGRGCPAQAL